MKIADLFEEIWMGVSSNKVRSGLTMLGIVIGIGSVIAMLAIGQGAKAQIEANIQSIGSNLLTVSPGSQQGAGSGGVSAARGSATTLTRDDADALKALPGVGNVSPEVSRSYQITAKGKNTNTRVTGAVAAYPIVHSVTVADGAFFTDSQNNQRAKVAVLGPTTRDDLFGTDATGVVGQKIRVNGMEFTVIGVTASKGGTGFGNQDDMVFIPLSTMQTYLSGSDVVSTIAVQAASQEQMADAQANITSTLLDRHKISNPALADFSVLSQADIVSAASSVTDTFTALLASIAGISLLVGGIGIMNMMLTTVTERTREIGLRQAIGAEKSEITNQFLGESVLLTLLGGGIGVALGFLVAYIVTNVAHINTQVSWTSVGMAFGISGVIGVVFGYYPARRAAGLNPIEALRYE